MPEKKKAPDDQKQQQSVFQDAQSPYQELSGEALEALLKEVWNKIPKKGSTPNTQESSTPRQTESSTPKPSQTSESSTPTGSTAHKQSDQKQTLASIALEYTKKQIPAITYGEIVTKT